MSFDIYIGNAEIEQDEDGEIYVAVRPHVEPDAPVFPGDDMTGNENSRHPGYTQWGEFVRAVGLHKLFFDRERGLMRSHPGTFMITTEDLGEIISALNRHPKTLPPGWCDCERCAGPFGMKGASHVDLDGNLARLLWLEWWFRWAIMNCERPAIHNH